MVETVLSKRRVDPTKVDRLREYFASVDVALFERTLSMEGVHTEAAFLRDDETETALYYYAERADEQPDLSLADIDDEAVVELAENHRAVLSEVCVEPAPGADGSPGSFEPLLFASNAERPE